MAMYDIINGEYIKIFCYKKYNYIIDNILCYYDKPEYEGCLIYVMLGYYWTTLYSKFQRVIFYNVEHVFSYETIFGEAYHTLIKEGLKNNYIKEFWDFDIINYQQIINNCPELIKFYKFKPFRYIDYKQVDNNVHKKYDAIQIGGTRKLCPYRNNILWTLSENSDADEKLSFLNIERSKYSLTELYDEINSAKFVLNIPRFQNSGQEQVRLGQLISMNCNILTQSFNISYLSDFVHEIDFTDKNIVDIIKNTKVHENVASKFKEQTQSEESYKKYIQQCYNKWYEHKIYSYRYTVIVPAVKGETAKNTIENIKYNNESSIQILLIDIGDNSVKEYYDNNKFKNVFYIKSDTKTYESAYNLGIKYAKGEYVCFTTFGGTYTPLFFDKLWDTIQTNSDNDIFVFPYFEESKVYNLMFEQLKIGPLLHCCMFKRSIVDIMLEENIICSTIIFSGILCKRFPYYKIKADMFYTYFGYMNNLQNKDSECLPKIVSEYDKNWIEYTQNKINAYCLNAQNQ